MKPEFERELCEAVSGPGEVGPVIEKIVDEYSTKISEALNPIDRVSAPFMILLLNSYAETIAAHYPEARVIAAHMRAGMHSVDIVIPVKRSDSR